MEKIAQLQMAQAAFRSKSPYMFDVQCDSKQHVHFKKNDITIRRKKNEIPQKADNS